MLNIPNQIGSIYLQVLQFVQQTALLVYCYTVQRPPHFFALYPLRCILQRNYLQKLNIVRHLNADTVAAMFLLPTN